MLSRSSSRYKVNEGGKKEKKLEQTIFIVTPLCAFAYRL